MLRILQYLREILTGWTLELANTNSNSSSTAHTHWLRGTKIGGIYSFRLYYHTWFNIILHYITFNMSDLIYFTFNYLSFSLRYVIAAVAAAATARAHSRHSYGVCGARARSQHSMCFRILGFMCFSFLDRVKWYVRVEWSRLHYIGPNKIEWISYMTAIHHLNASNRLVFAKVQAHIPVTLPYTCFQT